MADATWNPGDTIVLQDIWEGRLWNAKPMIVVEDRGDFIAAWMPKGTPWQCAVTPPTRPKSEDRGVRIAECIIHRDWHLEERAWPLSTLWLMKEGWPFAVWVSWLETGERFGGWYVNIQEPIRRTERSLQTMDLTLDVVIDADRRWRWKDEDELELLVQFGAIDAKKAADTRKAGETAISLLEQSAPPFNERWAEWVPDPRWGVPALPDEWNALDVEQALSGGMVTSVTQSAIRCAGRPNVGPRLSTVFCAT